jgi:phosphoribosylglycinamide formyltransferase-1
MSLKIGWFTTARGPGSMGMFSNVINAIQAKQLDAEISFVFSNREQGEFDTTDKFFQFVENNNVPLITLSSKKFKQAINTEEITGNGLPAWRIKYDEAISELITGYTYDIGVLGGYMLIFSGQFCKKHYLLNLHPALPNGPTGTWQEVIVDLIHSESKDSGIMMHQAIEEVDRGPVATYCQYSIQDEANNALWEKMKNFNSLIGNKEIENSELFLDIRERGISAEPKFILATLQAFAEKRITVTNAVMQTQEASLPIDISDKI